MRYETNLLTAFVTFPILDVCFCAAGTAGTRTCRQRKKRSIYRQSVQGTSRSDDYRRASGSESGTGETGVRCSATGEQPPGGQCLRCGKEPSGRCRYERWNDIGRTTGNSGHQRKGKYPVCGTIE